MRAFDWDPIRAEHYGQRLHRRTKQAGHMTHPTNAAATQKVLAKAAPSTHDPKRTLGLPVSVGTDLAEDVATRGGATHPSVHPAEVRRCRPTRDSKSTFKRFIFGHFTSCRTCATMLTRAVSEGDAARPITASYLRARMQD